MSPDIKQKLLDHCFSFVQKRIETIRTSMTDVQDAANEETKSSAGDKYETGRSMAHLEMEKNSEQLAQAEKMRQLLNKIQVNQDHVKIQAGSVVITDRGNFYIAISAGPVTVNGNVYMTISSSSPIGTKLLGVSKDQSFVFNNQSYHILDVF